MSHGHLLILLITLQAARQAAEKRDLLVIHKAEQLLRRRQKVERRTVFASWALLAAERINNHTQAYILLADLQKSIQVCSFSTTRSVVFCCSKHWLTAHHLIIRWVDLLESGAGIRTRAKLAEYLSY